MSRAIEQALTSLVPRHNGALPPELLELASSLLAQSRSKASNLKAEEEIGRTYACANIACERLKQSLNLPKIEPRPPCPPRIYNKLYSYFDTLLVAPKKRGRPPKTTSNPSTPSKVQKTLPTRPTPSKETTLTPYKTTPSRPSRRGLHFADSTTEIPPWIHPTIRALCKELHAEAAAPHILAGTTTILTLPSPASTSADEHYDGSAKTDKKDKLPALLVAVNAFVSTKLSGRATSGPEYTQLRTTALEILAKLRDDETLTAKILGPRAGKARDDMKGKGKETADKAEQAAWQGWEAVGTKDVDAWLLEISSRGWLSLDWFTNIVEGAGLQRATAFDAEDDSGSVVAEDENDEEGEDVADSGAFQQGGLGTMMQDRVDFLSEKKRAAYRVWKRGIIARIEEMERADAGAQAAMDTGEG